ncbi:hypothetical protein SB6421_05759 [Klebsiella huaxiensis]|nr:hypothetical protein SB6421_05759 [Klebsiella huaxiensis]
MKYHVLLFLLLEFEDIIDITKEKLSIIDNLISYTS